MSYYEINKEARLNYQKEYYKMNKEEIRKYNTKYKREHYVSGNPDRVKQTPKQEIIVEKPSSIEIKNNVIRMGSFRKP